jgi:FkbM family methyltransferase
MRSLSTEMINRLLKRLARKAGFVVASTGHRSSSFIDRPPETAFDLVLLQTFPNLDGLRFIQIGANDGQRVDPLLPYLEKYAWSGLLFEPLKENFAALSRRHTGNQRLTLRHAAVDTVAGRRTLYDVDRRTHPGLPDWAYGLASFDRDRVANALRELGLDSPAIIEETVETCAWSEVWRDFGAARCDLLVLDTEGYDLTLLRSAGLAEHRPRLIHFEHAFVSGAERLAFYGELLALGYELATDGPDTTAWLKS